MTDFDAGAIILVRFPFTDFIGDKKRPAVVISPSIYSLRFGDVVVMALTSQDQHDPDLMVNEWRLAGLLKPTWVKPLIGTISATLIERQLGLIDARDRIKIRRALDIVLGRDWD